MKLPLPRDYWQHQIKAMDPQTQWAEIFGIVTGHEFPWESQHSSEVALVHTFAVPEIAELLARTREFLDHTEKRFDDTAVILVEAGNYIGGQTDDATAIRRLNRMHGAYDIPNDQMIYVLSTFPVMARRWIDRYGYRPMNDVEIESMVRYWQRTGELMGISDIPGDYDEFAAYFDAYEHEHFGYSEGGRAITDATLDLLSSWYVAPLRPLVRWVGISLFAPYVRRALGYDDPPTLVRTGVAAVLQARKRVLRWMPARREFVSPLERLPMRTYPGGYDIATVGTFPVREGKTP